MIFMVVPESSYLEHYGRMGMKWYQHIYGEADGRAKYVEKFKDKEMRREENRFSRESKPNYKGLAKAKKKLETYPDDPKIKRNIEWYQSHIDYEKQQFDKIMKRLSEYTMDDIMKEQKYVNRRVKDAIIQNMAGMATMMATYSMGPVGVGVYTTDNVPQARHDYRLYGDTYAQADKAKAEKKAAKRAAKEAKKKK